MSQESGPRTQRDQLIERGVSALSKGVAGSLVKLVANSTSKLVGKAVARGASPLLVLADITQAGAECVAAHLGCEGETTETVGQCAGLASSAGIGATLGCVGGPPGAAIGAGVAVAFWLGGEVVGKGVNWLFKVVKG